LAGAAPQARPHAAGLRRLTLALALAAPGAAHAGAWVTAGEDRSITTVGYRESEDGVAALETDVFTEEALGERFALVGRAYYAQDALGFSEDETDAGLKVALHRGRRTALALQGSGTYVSAPTVPGCDRWGGEARALAGVSSQNGRRFANLEAAYRYSPGCSHARYELTGGYRPGSRWLSLAQAYVDDDLKFGETIKAQASLIRFTEKGRGVQISLRFRVDDGAVIEPTLILGYWSRPRPE
jgi:hypothetical protein